MAALARRYGPQACVWRYDPVVLTSITPAAWHRTGFAALASALRDYVSEVVLSWMTVYRKTARNLDLAAAEGCFAWQDPPEDEKRALLASLGAIARDHGLTPSLCAQPALLTAPLVPASCIDAHRLSQVADWPINARRKGNRPGCDCAESRDIGAYDTCPHGCAYCYATRSRAASQRRNAAQDPAADRLGPGKL